MGSTGRGFIPFNPTGSSVPLGWVVPAAVQGGPRIPSWPRLKQLSINTTENAPAPPRAAQGALGAVPREQLHPLVLCSPSGGFVPEPSTAK